MARKSVACAGLAAFALAPQADAFTAGPAVAPSKTRALRASALASQGGSPAASSQAASAGAAFGLAAAAAGLGFATAVARGTKKQAAQRAATSVVSLRAAKVGDAIPNVGLDSGFPPTKVMLGDFCKGKKVVLVPGYLAKETELKAKGVSDVLVYCVNDGAVMTAWAKDQGVEGSIVTFLGDPRSELTKELGLTLDHPGPMSVLGNPRCKRFSMLIDNGVIKTINVAASDDDPAGDNNPTVSLAEKMLEDL